jgi:transcriptional regulator with XRE-family HTH domain
VPNEKLRDARITAGLSLDDMARACNQTMGTVRSGMTGNYLGKVERGVIDVPSTLEYVRAICAVLKRPAAELGLVPKSQSPDSVGEERSVGKTGPVKRRNAIALGGAAISGMIVGGPNFALLMPARERHTSKVTSHDITEILEAAESFKSWDNARGGAFAREIADDALRLRAQLLNADYPRALGFNLYSAMAELATVVAFMQFDAFEHDTARLRFTFALQCAQEAGTAARTSDQAVTAWQLRASTLADMARQEVWCGRADDGLTYVDMALVRADRLTHTERAMLHTIRARALAKLGPDRAQDAIAAVGRADEEFVGSTPCENPTWMRFYDHAQHHGDTAHALFDVALHSSLTTEAAPRLAYAVKHHAPEYARSRTISRTKLAALTMAKGDPQEAGAIGMLAVNEAGPLRSKRAAAGFHELHRLATPHRAAPEVQALQSRIEDLVGSAA